MHDSCLKKQDETKALFADCEDAEAKYCRIIELGRELPKLDEAHKTAANRVKGCQSIMHLHAYLDDARVVFEAEADSMISAGLAALLIRVYSGETPETILKCPPTFLEDLNINASLTMNRANGLASLHLHMQQAAIKLLMSMQQS